MYITMCFHTASTSKVKKAVGCDGIPAKLIMMAASSLVKSLTHLINKSISTSVFPDGLADIKPAYKCKDILSKEKKIIDQ